MGARNARVTLDGGFTTVRNVGASGFSDVALRDAINAGDVPGPRMLVSGPPLSITGGHADNNLLPFEYHAEERWRGRRRGWCAAQVGEDIKYGADLIKFMASGGVLSHGDNPQASQYTQEEMPSHCGGSASAGKKGCGARARSGGRSGGRARQAWIRSNTARTSTTRPSPQMKKNGTYLVPTLYLMDWFFENAGEDRHASGTDCQGARGDAGGAQERGAGVCRRE